MTPPVSATADTASDTIFSLLRRPDLRASRADWSALVLLILVGWVGATAFLGRYRPNEVARALNAMIPGDDAFHVMLGAAVAVGALGVIVRQRRLTWGAALVAAFLAGHVLYARLYAITGLRIAIPHRELSDAVSFAGARLLWAASILATTAPVAYLALRRGDAVRLRFRWGDWSVAARDVSLKEPPRPYSRTLVTGNLLAVVIVFMLAQAGVAFRPVRSLALVALLPAILLSAVANATAEEVVFRGVLQPVFIHVGGVAAGLWAQGALFGLLHWGTSVGVLAALPMSLAIGLGSVVWGKAALETGGLGWVIVAHMMMDIAVMSAYFL